MKWLQEKSRELFSNIWVKLIAIIPPCFFSLEDREIIMLTALLSIMTIDCVLGAMVANYVDENFEWGLLGKKFSKKFLLYFLTLTASFILSKAYEFVGWWLYFVGTLITFAEFGSLMTKAKKLGLPIKSEVIDILNFKIDDFIKSFLNINSKKKKGCKNDKDDNKVL
jgi:hypothetical protein